MKLAKLASYFLPLAFLSPFLWSLAMGKDKTPLSPLEKEAKGLQKRLSGKGLPADWKVEVTPHTVLPFQWKGDLAKGLKVRFFCPSRTSKKTRAYAEHYPPQEREVTVVPQMTRYLYRELDGGYSYTPMERTHPDQWFGVTSEFVVVVPSSVGKDADNDVAKEVSALFEKTFPLSGDHQVLLEESPPSLGEKVDREALKKKYPKAKAVIYRPSPTAAPGAQGHSVLRVVTLK